MAHIFCCLSLILCINYSLYAQELDWFESNTLNFIMNETEYHEGSVYFYYKLFSKNSTSAYSDHNSESFSKIAKPLDLYNYWGQKEDESYDVLLTKTAYVLNQAAAYFTSERLSDPAYIGSTMPHAALEKSDSVFHIAVGFGTPDIDYTLQFYENENFKNTYPTLDSYFSLFDGINLEPQLISIQHNFNYSRVLFQKTTKMSISISRYFPLNDQQTLVLNYTLNYIYNMPPEIIGGSEFLVKKIKEGIDALVSETQLVCMRSNNP